MTLIHVTPKSGSGGPKTAIQSVKTWQVMAAVVIILYSATLESKGTWNSS